MVLEEHNHLGFTDLGGFTDYDMMTEEKNHDIPLQKLSAYAYKGCNILRRGDNCYHPQDNVLYFGTLGAILEDDLETYCKLLATDVDLSFNQTEIFRYIIKNPDKRYLGELLKHIKQKDMSNFGIAMACDKPQQIRHVLDNKEFDMKLIPQILRYSVEVSPHVIDFLEEKKTPMEEIVRYFETEEGFSKCRLKFLLMKYPIQKLFESEYIKDQFIDKKTNKFYRHMYTHPEEVEQIMGINKDTTKIVELLELFGDCIYKKSNTINRPT